jgi:hypothetical protein
VKIFSHSVADRAGAKKILRHFGTSALRHFGTKAWSDGGPPSRDGGPPSRHNAFPRFVRSPGFSRNLFSHNSRISVPPEGGTTSRGFFSSAILRLAPHRDLPVVFQGPSCCSGRSLPRVMREGPVDPKGHCEYPNGILRLSHPDRPVVPREGPFASSGLSGWSSGMVRALQSDGPVAPRKGPSAPSGRSGWRKRTVFFQSPLVLAASGNTCNQLNHDDLRPFPEVPHSAVFPGTTKKAGMKE